MLALALSSTLAGAGLCPVITQAQSTTAPAGVPAAGTGRKWPKQTPAQQAALAAALHAAADKAAQGAKIELAWHESAHFLAASQMGAEDAKANAAQLEEGYAKLCGLFGYDKDANLWQGKCLAVSLADAGSYQKWMAALCPPDADNPATRQAQADQEPDEGCDVPGTVFPGSQIIQFHATPDDPDEARTTVQHELAHAFLAQMDGDCDLPSWVNEGFAEYFATGGARELPRLLDSDRRLHADGGLRNFFNAETIDADHYGAALSLAAFLMRENPKGYLGFIKALTRGQAAGAALERFCHVTERGLEIRYGQHSLETAPPTKPEDVAAAKWNANRPSWAWPRLTAAQETEAVAELRAAVGVAAQKAGLRLAVQESAHFLVCCDGGDEAAQQAAQLLEAHYARLGLFFGCQGNVFQGKCAAVVLADEAACTKWIAAAYPEPAPTAAPNAGQHTGAESDAAQAEASPTDGNGCDMPDSVFVGSQVIQAFALPDQPGSCQDALRHAATQAFVAQMHGRCSLPSWMDEGVASHFSAAEGATPELPEALRNAIRKDGGLSGFFASDAIAAEQCPAAAALAGHLIGRDAKAFVRFIEAQTEGVNTQDALQKEFRTTTRELEETCFGH